MKYCPYCNVQVTGTRTGCPLCQNELQDKGGEAVDVFPVIPTVYRRYNLFFRILIFLSVAAVIVTGVINFLMPDSGLWSLMVAGAIVCMWILLLAAVRKRKNAAKTVLWQTALLFVIAILWDVFTGWHGWSIDYVIPSLCVSAMVALAISSRVMHLHMDDFILYMFVSLLFGILPIISLGLGLLDILFPSVICVAISVLSIAALLIFQGSNMIGELKRRLHL